MECLSAITGIPTLLDQSLVALLRTIQRLLAGDAELRQQPTNRIGAQPAAKLDLDQLTHHDAPPKRERKLQLQRILLRNGLVDPLQGASIQFGRSSKQRLGLQRAPSTAPILRQPTTYRPRGASSTTRPTPRIFGRPPR